MVGPGIKPPRLAGLSAEKRALLELLLEKRKGAPRGSTIPLSAEPGPAPLSSSQRRLWFLEALEPGTATYHIRRALRINGPLDAGALETSLKAIIERHEPLRTSFEDAAGAAEPIERVHPEVDFALDRVRLQAHAPEQRDRELARGIELELRRPFALDRAPLFRALLFSLGETAHVLVLSFHHLIADGWSLGVFFRELAEQYAARTTARAPSLPDLPIRYADYARFERDRLGGDRLDAQTAYWRAKLADLPRLELPIARARHATETDTEAPERRGARRTMAIPQALFHALKGPGERAGATPFMVLLATFEVLLHRYTGETDLAVGTPIANRGLPELSSLIGCFINTLVLRTDLAGDPSFLALLERVKATALEAFANQDLPFDRLVQTLAPARRSGEAPLFQVLLALQTTPAGHAPELSGLAVEPLAIDPGTAPQADLALYLDATPAGLTATFEYDAARFDEASIGRLMKHFHTLLERVSADPERPISQLRLLTEDEEQTLLTDWNRIESPLPEARTLHRLCELAVDRAPDRIAVEVARAGDEEPRRSITYRTLDLSANRLAHRLRALGVGTKPDVPVGLLADRSIEMVVGLVAILKAGGAYVPLDPAYPKERLDFMIADSGMKVLVTDLDPASDRVRELDRSGLELVSVTTDPAGGDDSRRSSAAEPEDLAYLIYTSGSTGRPKGVEIPHRAVVNLLASMARDPGIGPEDVLLAVTTLSFDIAAGWRGGPRLRIMCGGEALNDALAEQLLERGASVHNLYGPTETTIWSALEPVQRTLDARARGRTVLEAACAEPARRISELPLLTPVERERILTAINRTERSFPDEKRIHELSCQLRSGTWSSSVRSSRSSPPIGRSPIAARSP